MKRTVGILMFVLLAGAALASVALLWKPRNVKYAGRLVATLKPLPQLKLSADGAPVPDYRVEYELAHRGYHIWGATAFFEIKSGNYYWKPPDSPPDIRAEGLFPCGWTPTKLKVVKAATAEEIREAAKQGKPVYLGLSIDQGFPDDWMSLWVDNRDGAQALLSVGRMAYTIPAGSYDKLDFAVPDCAEGRKVTLDGVQIGTVPQRGNAEAESTRNFLVDASGRRCYRSRSVEYSVLGWTMQEPETHYYRRDRFHKLELGSANFFLEPAPKSISGRDFSLLGSESALEFVHELVEIPCS